MPIAGAETNDRTLPQMIAEACEPLPGPDEAGFGAFFDRFANSRVVLLGEASHGTSEFYRARAAITRRLIERHGFTIVAVEADWPDAAAVDRYVRDRPHRAKAGEPFRRFPRWMWRNTDVATFVDWLRERNLSVDEPDRRAGFYGLDMYSRNDPRPRVGGDARLEVIEKSVETLSRRTGGYCRRYRFQPR